MAKEDPTKKATVVKSEKDLPKGGVWETNSEGVKEYVIRKKGATPPSNKRPTDESRFTKKTSGSPTRKKPTSEPKTEFNTEERYTLEPTETTTTTKPEDKWKKAWQAFGFEGERQKMAELPNKNPVFIDGQQAEVFGYKIGAKADKTGKTAWDSHANMADGGTDVYGYVHPKTGEVVFMDFDNMVGKERDINGKKGIYSYTNEDIVPYKNVENVKKNFEQGATRPVGDETYLNSLGGPKVDMSKNTMGTLNARQGGFNTPVTIEKQPLNTVAPIQGAAISDQSYQSGNPYSKAIETGKIDPLLQKKKKGGIVGKYAPGGPVQNPYVKYDVNSIYNKLNANKAINSTTTQGAIGDAAKIASEQSAASAGTGLAGKYGNLTPNEKAGLGSMISMGTDAIGAGIDAADRKDGRSSYGGQIGTSALKGAGKGAAIGLNPALMAMTGGNSAWIAPVAGAVIGGTMGGIRAGKEKKAHREFTANEFSEAAANSQFDPANPNKVTRASDYDERDYKTIKGSLDGGLKMNGLGKKFGVTKFAATGGLIEKYNKGGQIVGSGTGTSDSISADIKGKSFVVPAENSGIAKLIRRDVLSDNPNKKAELKQGGVPVKVSNGEHLFTPEEVKELTAKGIDLDKLAPEAQTKLRGEYKFAKGGGVGDEPKVTTKRRYSSGNPSIDAEIDNLYKTGKWDEESVKAIEQKAKSLGLETGIIPFGSATDGVFADMRQKQYFYNRAVNKELASSKAKQQNIDYAKKRGNEYATKYADVQNYNKQLEDAKINTQNYTANQLKDLTERAKRATIEYSKLGTPSNYATDGTKKIEGLYEKYAKQKYQPNKTVSSTSVKPTQVVTEDVEIVWK